MQGRNDLVAPAESPDAIISQIGSEQRELVWWENTGHQLLVIGPHRKAIYRRIAEFLAER
jgi:esterase/lipase